MANYIESAEINILNGLFAGSVTLSSRLNFISGENGTLKTKFLQALREGKGKLHEPGQPCRIQAISPKRNAERRTFQAIFQQFRKTNMKLEALINQRKINDQTFDNYPSLGDLYYVVYDDLCKDGGNQIEKMAETARQFNTVIKSLFEHYELISEWNSQEGRPTIELLKNESNRVPLEGLSLGEQEMLSLVANFYTSRDRYDVFLVDEPEVHLNWHLEESLFQYLDDFCEIHKKQMVVVTHSRAVFKERFLPKTQFFTWTQEGAVACGRSLTREQQTRIAGDAIEIVRLGDFSKTTFFVEDQAHEEVIRAIADVLNADVSVSRCGNSPNVRSLYRQAQRQSGWGNTFYLEDGDNEGNPFPSDPNFVHLSKYCIENYLLDWHVASEITGKTEQELRQIILTAIMARRAAIFQKNKFVEFLADLLTIEHITEEHVAKLDASVIMSDYLDKVGMASADYTQAYVRQCQEGGSLDSSLPKQVVEIIKRSCKNELRTESALGRP
jgi:predicted ATPase